MINATAMIKGIAKMRRTAIIEDTSSARLPKTFPIRVVNLEAITPTIGDAKRLNVLIIILLKTPMNRTMKPVKVSALCNPIIMIIRILIIIPMQKTIPEIMHASRYIIERYSNCKIEGITFSSKLMTPIFGSCIMLSPLG